MQTTIITTAAIIGFLVLIYIVRTWKEGNGYKRELERLRGGK